MILKYPNNIGNNPMDLLSPQHDSFVSCLGENFLMLLKKRGLLQFSYYDPETDKKFIIKIEDYFLQPTFENSEYMTLSSLQPVDHFQLYDLFLNIKIYSNNVTNVRKWVCVGQIPKMQERGGFVRNGVKRVLLNQLIRSPGLYRNVIISSNSTKFDDLNNPFLKHRKAIAKIIPEYGTWLRVETLVGGPRRSTAIRDPKPFYTRDRILCTTDSLLRVPFVLLLTGLGIPPSLLPSVCSIGSKNNPRNLQIWNEEIRETRLGNLPKPWSRQQALSYLWLNIKPYKRRRVPRTPEAVATLLMDSFYNPTTYSLGRVGRKQLSSQLGMNSFNRKDSDSLEISDLCVIANQLITMRWDKELSPQKALSASVLTNPESLSNRMVRTSGELLLNCIVSELSNLDRLDQRFRTKQEGNLTKIQSFKQNFVDTNWEVITSTHYTNIIKSENFLKTGQEDKYNPSKTTLIINNINRASYEVHMKDMVLQRFVSLCYDAILRSTKTFLTAIQISQLEDTLNPLSDLTLKRRISVLGPGGITRSQASITMRNIHPTTYGRLCPIETPEGQNAGLVRSLAMHAFIPPGTGQIEVPFIDIEVLNNQSFIKYTDSFTDKAFSFGIPDVMIAEKNIQKSASILIKQGLFFNKLPIWDCSFFGISPIQLLSVGTTLTPFLEHDDATRVLMGSNMQRQSLSLISCERPIVGTGSEILIGLDSRHIKRSSKTGLICGLNSQSVYILTTSYKSYLHTFKYAPNLFSFFNSYNTHKTKNCSFNFFPSIGIKNIIARIPLSGPKRSNKATISRSVLSRNIGDWVGKGSLISQETGLENGQLALGCNLRVVYMPWDGFNFEDAIVFNQTTAFSEKMKTFHIKRFDLIVPVEQTITSDFSNVPGVLSSTHKHLDSNGFVIPGSCVRQGDALVGIVGKSASSKSWKIRLMKKLAKIDPNFSMVDYELTERSLFVPLGLSGRVIAVQKRQIFDGLHVRIYLLMTRFLQVGDKLSGRHGNKGVISTLVSSCDMPYKPNGDQADIILNPLGVPSRMNLGQIFECLLGLAGQQLQQRYKVLAFDEIFAFEASKRLCYTKLYEAQNLIKDNSIFDFGYPGKTWMIDGRNGKKFEQPVVFGVSYILKLCHQVDEKLHGRSVGEYSLVTQQPVQGRARGGGQRVGEMEVWAFQGFGTSYMLQELLSIKSDDVRGRKEAAKMLLRGSILYTKEFKSYRKPQTLQVVSYEMRALCMDFRLSST